MNRAILVGRLARDPELRTTNSGMSVCRFTVAVDRRGKSDDQTADFISCVAFGKTGETISQYLNKGRRIALEGRIQTGSYEKDGVKRYTTDIIVDSFDFIDSRSDGGQAQQQQQGPDDVDPDFHLMSDDDDLPF